LVAMWTPEPSWRGITNRLQTVADAHGIDVKTTVELGITCVVSL
jgi:hypothetical protein